MKTNLTRTMMLTAAMVTLGAAAAYAETKVVANVPFSFRTNAGQQAPGRYGIVSMNQSAAVMGLRNLETGHLTVIGVGTPVGRYDGVSRSRLVFHCGSESGCALAEVWNGDGQGKKFSTPRLKSAELERIAVVYLDNKSAE